MNINSLRKLGGVKQILVPAGLAGKLKLKGFRRIKELHWWESVHIHGVKFTFVPSQHWTRRNPWDTNSSHWGGWVMEPYATMPSGSGDHSHEQVQLHGMGGSASVAEREQQTVEAPEAKAAEAAKASVGVERPGHSHGPGHAARPVAGIAPTVYFAGDSGYFPGFKDIGRKFHIDVALMPIGAYEPEWFMGPQHVTPEESLQAFEDVEAKFLCPCITVPLSWPMIRRAKRWTALKLAGRADALRKSVLLCCLMGNPGGLQDYKCQTRTRESQNCEMTSRPLHAYT